MGRLLAFDYGKKRIGIAVTDPGQIIASGLATVAPDKVLKFVAEYLENETIDAFIIGKPTQMNNEPSESAVLVRNFTRSLKNKFPGIPVKMVDERFTSKMATMAMLEGGLKKKQRQDKAMVDSVSAALILQSYMENLRNQ